MKNFKIKPDQIKEIATNYGGCIASDMITVDGLPILYAYRERPSNSLDSGWRFLSGLEDDAYMGDSSYHAVYDINTIANYDPTIVTILDAPIGSEFEKPDGNSQFTLIES